MNTSLTCRCILVTTHSPSCSPKNETGDEKIIETLIMSQTFRMRNVLPLASPVIFLPFIDHEWRRLVSSVELIIAMMVLLYDAVREPCSLDYLT